MYGVLAHLTAFASLIVFGASVAGIHEDWATMLCDYSMYRWRLRSAECYKVRQPLFPIHTRCEHANSFVACVQCEHSHLQQKVSFVFVLRQIARPMQHHHHWVVLAPPLSLFLSLSLSHSLLYVSFFRHSVESILRWTMQVASTKAIVSWKIYFSEGLQGVNAHTSDVSQCGRNDTHHDKCSYHLVTDLLQSKGKGCGHCGMWVRIIYATEIWTRNLKIWTTKIYNLRFFP